MTDETQNNQNDNGLYAIRVLFFYNIWRVVALELLISKNYQLLLTAKVTISKCIRKLRMILENSTDLPENISSQIESKMFILNETKLEINASNFSECYFNIKDIFRLLHRVICRNTNSESNEASDVMKFHEEWKQEYAIIEARINESFTLAFESGNLNRLFDNTGGSLEYFFDPFEERFNVFYESFMKMSQQINFLRIQEILQNFNLEKQHITVEELEQQTDVSRTGAQNIPDPFGLIEKKMQQQSLTQRLEIFQGLKFIDKKTQYIPKLIHFVWVGSKFSEKNQFFENILYYGKYFKDYTENLKRMEEYLSDWNGWQVILWVDREYSNQEEAVFNQHGIALLNINILIDADNKTTRTCMQMVYLLLEIYPKNYGEASDILRYIILYKYGGLYCDVGDNPIRALRKFYYEIRGKTGLKNIRETANRNTNIFFMENMIASNNSILMSSCQNELWYDVLPKLIENYHELAGTKMIGDIRVPSVQRTVYRTGPSFISKAFSLPGRLKKIKGEENVFLIRYKPNYSGSWTGKKYTYFIDIQLSQEKVAKNIITGILYDIHDIGKLYLNKYNFYLRKTSRLK